MAYMSRIDPEVQDKTTYRVQMFSSGANQSINSTVNQGYIFWSLLLPLGEGREGYFRLKLKKNFEGVTREKEKK